MENILIAALGLLGAGFASWGGSRVATAELRKDNARIEQKADAHAKRLEDKLDDLRDRVVRLEGAYFRKDTT